MSALQNGAAGAPILYVGGSRGGVGKSWVSATLIDQVLVQGLLSPLIVDGDASNEHTLLAHRDFDPAPLPLDLDSQDGWPTLAQLADGLEHAARAVVMDAPSSATAMC